MPTKITFAPGSYGGTGDSLFPGADFTLEANAGQELTLIFGGGTDTGAGAYDLTAYVTGPDGVDLSPQFGSPSGDTLPLPVTGTYAISVQTIHNGAGFIGTITLCVLVVKPANI